MLTIFLMVFLACFVLTGGVRRYALWRHSLAMPEFRHGPLEPTPRDGGLAMMLILIALYFELFAKGLLELDTTRGLEWSSFVVLVTGLLRQLIQLSVRTRLALQALAAFAALNWYRPDLILLVFDYSFYLSGVWMVLPWLALIWFINLFNFMDGIDGFVGSQAFIMIFGSACLLALAGEPAWTTTLLLLCAPILGFLAWNWPPAKIFMGEVGAGALALLVSIIGMHLAAETSLNLWSWLILMSCFIVDGAWSLVVRYFNSLDWHRSHRMHAYQILARRWDSHFWVCVLLWAIASFWLMPLAYLAMQYEEYGLLILLLAMLPLLGGCAYLGAGQPRASVDGDED